MEKSESRIKRRFVASSHFAIFNGKIHFSSEIAFVKESVMEISCERESVVESFCWKSTRGGSEEL